MGADANISTTSDVAIENAIWEVGIVERVWTEAEVSSQTRKLLDGMIASWDATEYLASLKSETEPLVIASNDPSSQTLWPSTSNNVSSQELPDLSQFTAKYMDSLTTSQIKHYVMLLEEETVLSDDEIDTLSKAEYSIFQEREEIIWKLKLAEKDNINEKEIIDTKKVNETGEKLDKTIDRKRKTDEKLDETIDGKRKTDEKLDETIRNLDAIKDTFASK